MINSEMKIETQLAQETVTILVENLNCPKCGTKHEDIDKWAIDPHKTHLCLNCGDLFKGTVRGVSHPTFSLIEKPSNIIYQ